MQLYLPNLFFSHHQGRGDPKVAKHKCRFTMVLDQVPQR